MEEQEGLDKLIVPAGCQGSKGYCRKETIGYACSYTTQTEMFTAALGKAKELGCPYINPNEILTDKEGKMYSGCTKYAKEGSWAKSSSLAEIISKDGC